MFYNGFPSVGSSDQVIVSVFIDLLGNSKRDTLFHGITYDYSCVDWHDLRDNLRDVPCLLSVVSKVLLANNRLVDHLEKCGLCSDFQYGFRSS